MSRTLRTILPLLVLAVGIVVAAGLIASRSKPERAAQGSLPPRVEVIDVASTSAPALVEALGTVVAARTVTVQPEVSGRVVAMHPNLVPGGTIKKGEVIVRLDAREYQLTVAERRSVAAKARFELAVEEGRARVAQREWKLIGSKGTAGDAGKALALREPHLANAQANVDGAEAAVQRAELNVARTVIRAPFNILVTSESVEIGQIVNAQSRLATVVGTDEFWVQASVPVSSLEWIRAGEDAEASTATIRQSAATPGGAPVTGKVIRVLGELDPKGRMARVLVSIPDPLDLEPPANAKFLLGGYAQVEIDGRSLEQVFVLPRDALRDGGQLWVVDAQDTLRIRETTPVWRGQRQVYVRDGISANERVVVSRVSAPVDGMKVRVSKPAADQAKGKQP